MRRAESNSLLEMTRLATAGHQLSVVTPGDTQGCDLIIAMEDWLLKKKQVNKQASIF